MRAAVAAAAVLLIATGARASERSKILYSRGLVELNSNRVQSALELFNEAVAADSGDAVARYYRALVRERTGDVKGAIDDLEASLTLRPDFDDAALELGVALVERGDYARAAALLQRAQGRSDLEGRASLFLGLAQLRLGERDAARVNFRRAAADPELEVAGRYYEGVIDYQEGKWTSAEHHFQYVRDTKPDSDMGREASKFLSNMRQGMQRQLQLYGSVGFQYDSNVVLAPADSTTETQLGISNQADGRGIFSFGGSFLAFNDGGTQLSLGADFFQSLHFELHDFNLQDDRINGELTIDRGPVRFGFLGRFDYYLLKSDSFLREVTLLPSITVREGSKGFTELSVRLRRRQFLQRSFAIRDAFNYSPGIRQLFYLGTPDRYAWAGYHFERESPTGDDDASQSFAYDAHQIEGGLGWLLPLNLIGEASYAYRREGYAAQSAVAASTSTGVAGSPSRRHRHDNVQQVIAALRKPLTDTLSVVIAYLGTINNSNKIAFDYDRHIASLTLEARY